MSTEVVFSEIYQPLFDLLEARNVVNSKDFKTYSKENQKYWEDLSNVDTVLISGGRDSGKSFALSCFNPIAAAQYNHRILYTRQTMASTDNSITEALESRMELLGLDSCFEAANKIYSVIGGIGKISITGLKTSVGTQTAKSKSLEDFSIFETDEGEELESYNHWKKVKRSIRAIDVQCLSIISFNPPTTEHWLHEEFYENIPQGFNGVVGKILYIHSTYLDNGKDNMAEHNWKEYEGLRLNYEKYLSTPVSERDLLPKDVKRKYNEYKYDILGGFRNKAEGLIYENWEEGEFDESLPYCYGLDFGFNDPNALVKVAVNHNEKKIYLDECYFKNGDGLEQLYNALENIVGKQDLIVGDNASRTLIYSLYDKGLNIVSCRDKKPKIHILIIQGYTLIVTKDSHNLKKALNNYAWHDSRSGIPKHDWSDLCDAFRYGVMELLDYH
jgi:phage terminase large subunit